ncbi:MAG: hemerythrin domain-containing protein [Brevundimonas sp.]
MSDPLKLGVRTGLPETMRFLLPARPRDTWGQADLHPTARFWLQMHDGFRAQQAEMGRLTGAVRAGAADAAATHPRLIGLLGGFLQHLDHHHKIESGHYFPQFRAMEPRVAEGLALLDADHDVVHERLETLHGEGLAYHQAVLARSPEARDALLRFADALDAATPLLDRHLDDEEEIVIPLIATRGG